MKKADTCAILANDTISPGHYLLRYRSPAAARKARPGQFVQVRITASYDPLLRRPFSVHRVHRDTIELLYRVVGKGTALLAEKKSGDMINVLGPLGTGFTIPKKKHTAVLVAGGMGVAPLRFLAQELIRRKVRPVLLFGQQQRDRALERAVLGGLKGRCGIRLVSEQEEAGSVRGLVTDVLMDTLPVRTEGTGTVRIYACGPWAMFRALKQRLGNYNAVCQVSLEENMACGIGTCLGCVVKLQDRDEYRKVCTDGPVFPIREIDFDYKHA